MRLHVLQNFVMCSDSAVLPDIVKPDFSRRSEVQQQFYLMRMKLLHTLKRYLSQFANHITSGAIRIVIAHVRMRRVAGKSVIRDIEQTSTWKTNSGSVVRLSTTYTRVKWPVRIC